MQAPSTSLQEPSNSLQCPKCSLQGRSSSLQAWSTSLQIPSSSLQDPSNALQDLSATLQVLSTSLQVPSNSLQDLSAALQDLSNSLQVPSNALQDLGGFLQLLRASLQDLSNVLQVPSSSLQVAHATPRGKSVPKRTQIRLMADGRRGLYARGRAREGRGYSPTPPRFTLPLCERGCRGFFHNFPIFTFQLSSLSLPGDTIPIQKTESGHVPLPKKGPAGVRAGRDRLMAKPKIYYIPFGEGDKGLLPYFFCSAASGGASAFLVPPRRLRMSMWYLAASEASSDQSSCPALLTILRPVYRSPFWK